MSPRWRKVALTAHVTSSIGWLGAVAGFLALAVTGLVSVDAQVVRSADLGMGLITWFVIVPLCFASVLTGLISSLATPWGVFRHYWVLVKVLITIPATIVLVVHLQPITLLGEAARGAVSLTEMDLYSMRKMLAIAAGTAVFVLLVLTGLSYYKPRGITQYGSRKQAERRELRPSL